MEITIPDPAFKEMFFDLLEYYNPRNINSFVKLLLEELFTCIEESNIDNQSVFRQSVEITLICEITQGLIRKHVDFNPWEYNIRIPLAIRDKINWYSRRYGPIKYYKYDHHVWFVKGKIRRNITNALCHAIVLKAYKAEIIDDYYKLQKTILEGDIVEMVSGPFRGEKAKTTHINYSKEEITVELLDSMVPIPLTVRGEQIRVIKRREEDFIGDDDIDIGEKQENTPPKVLKKFSIENIYSTDYD